METNKRNNERIVFPQVIAPSKYHISRELPLFQSSQVNQGNAHRSWLIGDWLILPSSCHLTRVFNRRERGHRWSLEFRIDPPNWEGNWDAWWWCPLIQMESVRMVDRRGGRTLLQCSWRVNGTLEDPPRGRSVIRDWRSRLIRRRCAEGGRDPGIDPPEDRTTKLPGNVDVSRSKFRCCGVGIERIGSMKSERWGFREIFRRFNFDDGELTGDWFNRND